MNNGCVPFYRQCRAPQPAWQSFRWCELFAAPFRQRPDVYQEEWCNPMKHMEREISRVEKKAMKAELPWQPVSLKSNIWDVCKKHISRHDLLTICVKFRHIKAKCSSWFWCHITLAFFQLEMHGGIFHSCCSFTVIYDKREKLCHT